MLNVTTKLTNNRAVCRIDDEESMIDVGSKYHRTKLIDRGSRNDDETMLDTIDDDRRQQCRLATTHTVVGISTKSKKKYRLIDFRQVINYCKRLFDFFI